DLGVEWGGEAEDFERGCQQQNLEQRGLQAGEPTKQLAQADALQLLYALECRRRCQLESYTREMLGCFDDSHGACAACRVVNRQPACLDSGQHDEVIEIPMQHGRQAEFVEILKLDLDRPRLEAEVVG